MLNRVLILLTLLASGAVQAWDCEHSREIDQALDVSDSRGLDVIAAAGDLSITGSESATEVRIRATVCASSEEWAQEAGVSVETGEVASVAVVLPDTGGMSGWGGNRYAYLDLELEVPDSLSLAVRDSSGDIEIEGTGPVSVKDSSGDIELRRVRGDVLLSDSSGDIELSGIEGNVEVEQDSSGDIEGRDIEGSVLVARDSSGDIRFRDVRDDFTVERDSSGDIVADTIGGDFQVLRDGSGSIRHEGVAGAVRVPDDG